MAQMTPEDLQHLAEEVLAAQGFSQPQGAAIAAMMVAGQRDDCASHGIYRLLGIVKTLKAGKVVPDAEPTVEDVAPAIVRVDAGGGFSPLAFETGLPLLDAKARSCGLAALAINNCVHFSALWVEMEALTARGLVALACNPTQAYVAPAGGRRPLFGTNPLAFGWPRPEGPPFVFDFATSAVARGEIELHRRAGKALPEGWGVDAEGAPSNDARTVLEEGAMLTFGGHKGSALSAMIELLAGPLIGDLTSPESSAVDAGAGGLPYHGELILAFDPQRFLGTAVADYQQRAEQLFAGIEAQGARLPSQRRYQARERNTTRGWLEVPDELLADVRALLPG
ncbi:Ldh family oxidoreductase [Pseudomonas sp. HR1]|uniref:LDH2 family malate/lactate/ureidoglycolate dehydrogenase n=1 Tax=Ectopseudomonas oleovorans TaxID=301 RepID=A0A3D9EFL9_ECTOL|nr:MULTISPECIES: Ldh family oxidoreductase [Pseudomonas]MDK4201116.1 Ldh family oxidoreductase [Pseudomonas sp. HR1]QEU06098.1 Ldh family oxidoreductase [Pseudomonas oryzihabitans]RED01080.1 LDH2 family malate/lactate/ureidoglycolate dehydrogenase [Pseudomonas oleovorans]